ncbi:hypothetical protein AKG34_10510 [Peribacillus butanolivorans]|nr:hypothetical protein AKG34_10510 [Peribacillus butanolivorans]
MGLSNDLLGHELEPYSMAKDELVVIAKIPLIHRHYIVFDESRYKPCIMKIYKRENQTTFNKGE